MKLIQTENRLVVATKRGRLIKSFYKIHIPGKLSSKKEICWVVANMIVTILNRNVWYCLQRIRLHTTMVVTNWVIVTKYSFSNGNCFVFSITNKSFLGLDKNQELHTLFVRTSVDTGCLLVGHVIFLVVCVVLFSLSLICVSCPLLNESGLVFFVFDLCLVPNVEWVWIVFLCLWSVSCIQCWMSLDCLFLIFSSVFLYRFYLMSWRQILSKFKSTICYQ